MAETFRAAFLGTLVRRGPKGVRLVISDAHERRKAAIRRVLGATWQRCRVHRVRNAPAWSLSAEWTAYLAFPLVAWIAARLSLRAALAVLAALAVTFTTVYAVEFDYFLDRHGLHKFPPLILWRRHARRHWKRLHPIRRVRTQTRENLHGRDTARIEP